MRDVGDIYIVPELGVVLMSEENLIGWSSLEFLMCEPHFTAENGVRYTYSEQKNQSANIEDE